MTRFEVRGLAEAHGGKGAAGGLFFATDDRQAIYKELEDRGVEFTEEPSKRPYGIDAAFRDPSGNQVRIVRTM